jgi:pimeloyl-ACP methyl ester carboxylesterase
MLKRNIATIAIVFGMAFATPASAADPVKTGYAQANGLKMYYEVHGSGKPVVVLHGAYMSAESMRPIIEGLAKARQVIAVDLQAHGRTGDIGRPISYELMADDVAAMMQDINLQYADVFGYSMGGGVAYQLAIRHPDRVRRLAAASATYKTEGMYPALLAFIKQITPQMFAGSPWEKEYMRLAPDKSGWPVLIEKLKALDLTPQDWPADDIKAIKAPTLVISADADMVLPEHSVEIFRLRGGGPSADFMTAPTTELAILPGITHLGVMERTDLVVPMVAAFFDKEVK